MAKHQMRRIVATAVLLLIPLAFVVAAGPCPQGSVCLEDPLNLGDDPYELWGRLAGAFVGIAGAPALAFFVYGGFLWLTSGGSEERIKKGKATITWATLGLAVILGSYFILSYIINVLTTATGVTPH